MKEQELPEKIRIVGLEEHVVLPVLLEAWTRAGCCRWPHRACRTSRRRTP
jgi:hypothetical protein